MAEGITKEQIKIMGREVCRASCSWADVAEEPTNGLGGVVRVVIPRQRVLVASVFFQLNDL